MFGSRVRSRLQHHRQHHVTILLDARGSSIYFIGDFINALTSRLDQKVHSCLQHHRQHCVTISLDARGSPVYFVETSPSPRHHVRIEDSSSLRHHQHTASPSCSVQRAHLSTSVVTPSMPQHHFSLENSPTASAPSTSSPTCSSTLASTSALLGYLCPRGSSSSLAFTIALLNQTFSQGSQPSSTMTSTLPCHHLWLKCNIYKLEEPPPKVNH